MTITPVERALRIKQLRDKKASERAQKVRERAGRIAGKRGKNKKTATGKPRRARGSLSRDEIIKAAEDIMVTEGVEALSMRRVAERLGCSVASPYAHFKNQEEIMRELIIMGEQQLVTGLAAARASSTDVFVQLAAIAHAYWKFANENRERHRLMFTGAGGRLYRNSFPTLPRSYRVLLETVRHGVDTGDIPYARVNYPALARTLWAWMYGLIVLDLNGMMKYPKDVDPVDEGITFLTRMLRGGEHPKFERRASQPAPLPPRQ